MPDTLMKLKRCKALNLTRVTLSRKW